MVLTSRTPKSRTYAAEAMLAEMLWTKLGLFPTDPGMSSAAVLNNPLQTYQFVNLEVYGRIWLCLALDLTLFIGAVYA